MNERLNSAVTALITDSSMLSRFRRNPTVAMRQFKLSDCELDALKSGDERSLIAHGLAPELVTARPHSPHWFSGLEGTVARRMAAAALMALLLALAIQNAGSPTASANSARAKSRVGARLSRMREHGPAGLRTIKESLICPRSCGKSQGWGARPLPGRTPQGERSGGRSLHG
jgi:hypothetical protein